MPDSLSSGSPIVAAVRTGSGSLRLISLVGLTLRTLTIVPPVPKADGVKVHVYVEDTSYADASARIVLHHVVPALPDDDGTLRVELPALSLDERASYTVRVRVDVSGEGRLSAGDLITMESYPLAAVMNVRVRPITRR